MTFITRLLQRFGLATPKTKESDMFDLRLTRLHTRENRRDVRGSVFVRNPA